MSKLSFFKYELLIDGRYPDVALFNEKFNEIDSSPILFTNNMDTYACTFSIRNGCPWFYLKYGSPYPCPKNLVNIDDFSITNNTRTIGQVEQSKQLFALYVPEKGLMYVSNRKKIPIVVSLLKEELHLGNDITLKFITKSEDDLISLFNSISELRFTVRNENLFNKLPGLFDEAHNCYCLGAVNQLKLSVCFEPVSVTQQAIQKIKKLIGLNNNGSIFDLSFVGKGNDEQTMGALFNMNPIVEMIDIDVQEDYDTKMIEPVSTHTSLLKRLGIIVEE